MKYTAPATTGPRIHVRSAPWSVLLIDPCSLGESIVNAQTTAPASMATKPLTLIPFQPQ
jgi:hypothetical protein